MRPILLALLLLLATAPLRAEEVLRVAVMKAGTVAWELDTLSHYGLDEAEGLRLELLELASGGATKVAFQGDQADVMVADWVWVARQRAAGRDFVFIPYSKAVGGLLVPGDSLIANLVDLAGSTIGIAGGPIDKSWLILQAYAARILGFDIASGTDQVFGAPPLIYQKTVQGEIEGSINYWHFTVRLKAKGFRSLVSVAEAAEALGLDPDLPLIGYVVKGSLLREKPDLVAGLAAATVAAKRRLERDEAAWERLRPRMNAKSDSEFEALRAGFIEGIPPAGPVDRLAAAKFLDLLIEQGGETLVGEMRSLPDGLFYAPGD